MNPTGIKTPTLILKSDALHFDFSGAPTGSANQYISGFMNDGANDSYAKYVSTQTSATGNFNAATPGGGSLGDGNYILHIFSEEANGYLYSDFASQSVDFTFNVNSATVENLTLTSNSAFGLDNSSIALGSGTFNKAWSLANGSTLTTTSATFKPSSLSVHGKDNTITGNLSAQNATLNFHMPNGISAGSTLLNVDGDADISNSTVNLFLDGGALGTFAVSDTLNLISVGLNSLTANNLTTGVYAFTGISFNYKFSAHATEGTNGTLVARLDSAESTTSPPIPTPPQLHGPIAPSGGS
ncbi:hypothetical protein FACS1894116_11870 [Betaproteobacteria bacterium]|nr:hypothetical protein FACS1894116_11870 [Betaproteobacteria bacterium]